MSEDLYRAQAELQAKIASDLEALTNSLHDQTRRDAHEMFREWNRYRASLERKGSAMEGFLDDFVPIALAFGIVLAGIVLLSIMLAMIHIFLVGLP